MEGFDLLIGHLLGDYVFQGDWQALNKAAPWPGPRPEVVKQLPGGGLVLDNDPSGFWLTLDWRRARRRWWLGHLACTVHCVLYTLVVFLTSPWLPWWALAVIFLTHWPVDRFRLARVWMTRVVNQKQFAEGPLAPWSVIVVDQVCHLLVLWAVARLALL